MADEKPSLHIDTDWKKQAQEEKRRLAEDEQKRAAERERGTATAPAPGMGIGAGAAPGSSASAGAGATAGPARGRAGAPGASRERAIPEASFATLVNSLMTQVLLYLGELAPRGAEPQVNLDMAKFNIDLLGVLEEKTKGNLTPDEQKMLDTALYETRMRYVQVASQYATV
ncbi:MAG: hypothetical protein QOF78_77 [Phycisphaerales bacterium]|jgi:hypothetical protein|nr:hypothetical protein [Phycisphaerales bacterium]